MSESKSVTLYVNGLNEAKKIIEIFEKLKISYNVVDLSKKIRFGNHEIAIGAFWAREFFYPPSDLSPVTPTLDAEGTLYQGIDVILSEKVLQDLVKKYRHD